MDPTEQFVELLTRYQQRIFLFVLSLIPNPGDAEEVLQETNLILWRKFGEFEPDTNFKAWAFRIAYIKVQQYWTQRSQDRLRYNETFLQRVAEASASTSGTVDRRREALARCLERLPQKDRDLIRQRYRIGGTVKNAAEELGRTTHAVYKALGRARRMLHDCITARLMTEESH